jgi:hypothetical protein
MGCVQLCARRYNLLDCIEASYANFHGVVPGQSGKKNVMLDSTSPERGMGTDKLDCGAGSA